VVPRVLTVQHGPDVEDAEAVVAADGDAALTLLRREPFDAVLVDLRLEPIDSWCVLAAVWGWTDRPRLVAVVGARTDIGRALILGADLCVAAGTPLHARALSRSTAAIPAEVNGKETQCPRPPTISSPRTTKAGASA
jgi:DNA-binding response OmpR family regulator